MDSFGKVVCICADGFKGKRCKIAVTNCNTKPCNEGKCKVDDGKVKCSCGKKYMGEYCEIKVFILERKTSVFYN
ncbi:sushi, von Willebrand factor type A, EGF and pentraxin domain-containing 1 isoform X4 [Paramuricea clavata]|uniref:Sushi, von Willebrand factor type A, EGF and pentraxin domain-containing 1 isoform X4 n=1 Tax=Paramuricea clavata TaxID=317549 RepID=A0A6S7LAY9_PARCT|nr:sushi, von Willebrand factor type A, EGF and pentraxin domain-containing 1 isoform X4 [Paramuricea clavata]